MEGQVAQLAELAVVRPVLTPEELLRLDLSDVVEAPMRLYSAEVSDDGSGPYCRVVGYVAPALRFELRLPTESWTQRYMQMNIGGYGGRVTLEPWLGAVEFGSRVGLGQVATASSDVGHQAVGYGDALWALNNPQGVIDLAYAGGHKLAVACKELITRFYGQPPVYSYATGVSSGGRMCLQLAQRYPADFDGILADAPTIDFCATTTIWHAWNLRRNLGPDGRAILTRDKLPLLHDAVMKSAVETGAGDGVTVIDPWRMSFDARSLTATRGGGAALSGAQADAVNSFYDGPTDGNGQRLFADGLPYGSEFAWLRMMVPESGDGPLDRHNSHDEDFAELLSSFRVPTGINYRNMQFNEEHFHRLHEMTGLFDPTNPDLGPFSDRGGKLLIWQGLNDAWTSFRAVLHYRAAVREYLADRDIGEFLQVYLVPGLHHGGYGPDTVPVGDALKELMEWVEAGVAPGPVDLTYYRPAAGLFLDVKLDGAELLFRRPVAPTPADFGEKVSWLGAGNYTPEHTRWMAMREGTLVEAAAPTG